jgi:hypothetical protein
VPRLFDVELEDDVLVVADARRLHLREDLAHRARRRLRCLTRGLSGARGLSLDAREDALALAAAAADRLEAHALARVCLEERGGRALDLLGELVDGVEVEPRRVARVEHVLGRAAQIRAVGEQLGRDRQTTLAHDTPQRLEARVLAQEQARRRVVDARRHGHALAQRRALGLVLLAGGRLHSRARADEDDARALERAREGLVLRHEAVAREDVRVAVPLAEPDDLREPLLALGLRRAAVVAHAVNVLGRDVTQLGRERVRVDDGVLLAEEDPRVRDAHLREDVERLLADRSSADDERAHVLAREATHPRRGVRAQASIARDLGVGGVPVAIGHRGRRWVSGMGLRTW